MTALTALPEKNAAGQATAGFRANPALTMTTVLMMITAVSEENAGWKDLLALITWNAGPSTYAVTVNVLNHQHAGMVLLQEQKNAKPMRIAGNMFTVQTASAFHIHATNSELR